MDTAAQWKVEQLTLHLTASSTHYNNRVYIQQIQPGELLQQMKGERAATLVPNGADIVDKKGRLSSVVVLDGRIFPHRLHLHLYLSLLK